MAKTGNYHTDAQSFINGAKKLGMTVKNEGAEIIATPKGGPKKIPSLGKQIVAGVKKRLIDSIPGKSLENIGAMYQTAKGKEKMEKNTRITEQTKAKSKSPTGEMTKKNGKWVPYSYGKNLE